MARGITRREDVTDEVMREYLMTWLVMWGDKRINVDEAYEVDEAIGDEDELCWSIALNRKLIGKKYVEKDNLIGYGMGRYTYRLTKKAIRFIGGIENGNNTGNKT